MVGKPGKWPLGRPRRKWEDNIKIDLRKIGCEDGRCTDLVLDDIQ
jgi:hypothetical protein